LPSPQITEDIARLIAIDTESKPSRNVVVLDGYGAEVYKTQIKSWAIADSLCSRGTNRGQQKSICEVLS
jgi:hypothetical protein